MSFFRCALALACVVAGAVHEASAGNLAARAVTSHAQLNGERSSAPPQGAFRRQSQAVKQNLITKTKNESSLKTTKNSSDSNNSSKVIVEIFYETLCPYCQNFITNSLSAVWKDEELRQHLEVKFYPYGNAQTLPKDNVSEGYRFWHNELSEPGFKYVFPCQHGPDECFGNHLQACAIQTLATQEKYVPFIMCMEANDTVSQEMSSFDCAKGLGIDLSSIRQCVRGSEGNKLMSEIGKVTDGLQPPAGPKQYVPWITLNGAHSEQSELDGEPGNKGHFLAQVCSLIEEPLPSACVAMKSAASERPRLVAPLVAAFFTLAAVFLAA